MSCRAAIVLSYKVKSSHAYARESSQLTMIQFIRVLIEHSLQSVFKRKSHPRMVSYLQLQMYFHIIRFLWFQGKRILNFKDSLPSRLYSYRREVDQNLLDGSVTGLSVLVPYLCQQAWALSFHTLTTCYVRGAMGNMLHNMINKMILILTPFYVSGAILSTFCRFTHSILITNI